MYVPSTYLTMTMICMWYQTTYCSCIYAILTTPASPPMLYVMSDVHASHHTHLPPHMVVVSPPPARNLTVLYTRTTLRETTITIDIYVPRCILTHWLAYLYNTVAHCTMTGNMTHSVVTQTALPTIYPLLYVPGTLSKHYHISS